MSERHAEMVRVENDLLNRYANAVIALRAIDIQREKALQAYHRANEALMAFKVSQRNPEPLDGTRDA